MDNINTLNSEKASLYIMATAFGLVIYFQLVVLFFMLILTYILVKKLDAYLKKHNGGRYTKVFSIFVISVILVSLVFGINKSVSFLSLNYEIIFKAIDNLVIDFTTSLPLSMQNMLPDESIKNTLFEFLKTKQSSVFTFTIQTFHIITHSLIGILLGLMLSFRNIKPNEKLKYFEIRLNNLMSVFEKVFLGQSKISLINTAFTGVYLFLILPTLGYHIPYSGYLVFFTFIFGLLPVIGNLISNTLILIFSISLGFKITIISLIFLVVIHKFEYYINGLILGKKININVFETILVMVVFEGIFGLTGLFLSTLIYGYIKVELINKNII